jgi:SAM-dependent methyltransferase
MERQPYVTFYEEHGVNLVSREYQDLSRFFEARTYLFLSLGVVPSLLQGKEILEFGPGAGHNSVFTDSLNPARYVLVDGGGEILQACSDRLTSSGGTNVKREFNHCLFDQYQTGDQFDLVIAEACIPNQDNPLILFRHMQSFVRRGGIFIFTTVSSASWFSEILRRVARVKIASTVSDIEEQVTLLVKRLDRHFDALRGMARSPRNWILDNLIQPYAGGQLFPISVVLENLDNDWMVVGGSPKFLQDWQWYKDVSKEKNNLNRLLLEQYYSNVANLLDRRRSTASHCPSIGEQIERVTSGIWEELLRLESTKQFDLDWFFRSANELTELLNEVSPLTSKSLAEAVRWIENGCPDEELKYFPDWWGRGQQHLSISRLR